MLRNSKEIETNQHHNTPTNDGFIETELNAETPSSQDTEKAEFGTNNSLSSSESEQDEVVVKSETSSSQDTENADDTNYYLSSSDSSSSESEQDEKSQQTNNGFRLLPNFLTSLLSGLFGSGSPSEAIEVEFEMAVPPLPILSQFIEEVHDDIHLLQLQQTILLGQQKELAQMQQKLAAKQQEIAKELNQNQANEKRMQADLGRFYGKRMTFFCETGKPAQLVNVQANDEEKKNENDSDNDSQSSLRASM